MQCHSIALSSNADICAWSGTECDFIEGDAQKLPSMMHNLIVVSNLGICHVLITRALSEVRKCRLNGRFAMTVWCGPDILL